MHCILLNSVLYRAEIDSELLQILFFSRRIDDVLQFAPGLSRSTKPGNYGGGQDGLGPIQPGGRLDFIFQLAQPLLSLFDDAGSVFLG